MIPGRATTRSQPKDGLLRRIRDGLVPPDRCDLLLHESIAGGDVALVETLLDHGASAHVTAHGGATPLHQVTRANCSDADKRKMAAMLLERDANPNVGDERGYTPLHYAAFYGVPDMCRFLVGQGAQVNVRDKWLNTPLHWGIKSTEPKPVVKALIALGARMDMRNADGHTPVEVALMEKRHDALDVLQKVISTRHARRVKRLSMGRRRMPLPGMP